MCWPDNFSCDNFLHIFPGLTPPRGVLLYGPSGTGKSLLARTVISESDVYCITLNGPDVLSRYVD
jgi:SpoVK/Ycf46/Vps4 family AAA+-type ATPase